MRSNPIGKIRDRDLIPSSHMVNSEMSALRTHDHDARDEVVNMAEASGLAAIALKLEGYPHARTFDDCSLQSHCELRDHFHPTHARSIDIISPKYPHAVD